MKNPDTENFVLPESGSTVRIQSKIELPAYRRVMFKMTYSIPAVWFLHVLVIFIILFYLSSRAEIGIAGEWLVLFLTLMLAYLPFGIYRNASINYKSSKTFHELASYEFTPHKIIVTGESYDCTLEWKSLHKVREFKDYFLLYANKQAAMIIQKSAFASEADIATVRQYAQNVG